MVSRASEYDASIDVAILEIEKKYIIEPGTTLSQVLHAAMKKLLLGLDFKLHFYESLYEGSREKPALGRLGVLETYPVFASDFIGLANSRDATHELDQLFRVGKGLNKVVMHTLTLIHRNRDDAKYQVSDAFRDAYVGYDSADNVDVCILGSLLRRTINIYNAKNDTKLEHVFPHAPEDVYSQIHARHTGVLEDLKQG